MLRVTVKPIKHVCHIN